MTAFRTCLGCQKKTGGCDRLDSIKSAISGMGVSLLRHRCPEREPIYAPGDAVLITTRPWQETDEEGEPPTCVFRGVFIKQQLTKAICFIKPGTRAEQDGTFEYCEDDLHKFEPNTGNRGYVKVPLIRVSKMDSGEKTPVESCWSCGEIPNLTGCGWDGDPWCKPQCLIERKVA